MALNPSVDVHAWLDAHAYCRSSASNITEMAFGGKLLDRCDEQQLKSFALVAGVMLDVQERVLHRAPELHVAVSGGTRPQTRSVHCRIREDTTATALQRRTSIWKILSLQAMCPKSIWCTEDGLDRWNLNRLAHDGDVCGLIHSANRCAGVWTQGRLAGLIDAAQRRVSKPPHIPAKLLLLLLLLLL
eukprot:CAMPEP_0204052624 /NCGR_PEP_ID=MMETSP0360-20130528/124924_1 /ASSEMBLY_ACC=CAM_ASM_000342 /TAXON_ID=268821 /ORGANISM="Scrippsiella Hangoei, Strain SHTV-5" /LENGTH=186 /DNA_ID=CAMNT_0050999749 /DNA_START=216 /DNA_END=772 /DNA_ORIENTATION=+